MKLLASTKSQQNSAILDPWSLVHFSAGLAAGLMRLPLQMVMPTAFAYELVEQVLERHRLGREVFKTAGPESPGNAITDIALFALGHWMGEAWNRGSQSN